MNHFRIAGIVMAATMDVLAAAADGKITTNEMVTILKRTLIRIDPAFVRIVTLGIEVATNKFEIRTIADKAEMGDGVVFFSKEILDEIQLKF